MGKRRIHERALATLFAGTFLFVSWGDASGVHNCPHHDRLPGAQSQGEPASLEMDRTAHGESSQASEHPSHDEGPCTCLGDCQSTTPNAAVAPSRVAIAVHAPRVVHVSRVLAARAGVDDPPYLLPFANAPPHLI